jgi:hypothetical protein
MSLSRTANRRQPEARDSSLADTSGIRGEVVLET